MASIYDLKPRFQALLRPLTRRLAGAGVTANQVTVFAALLSAAAGLALYLRPAARWPLLLIPAVLAFPEFFKWVAGSQLRLGEKALCLAYDIVCRELFRSAIARECPDRTFVMATRVEANRIVEAAGIAYGVWMFVVEPTSLTTDAPRLVAVAM